MELTVKLQVFEGPLDLLLHLLEKNKVNIYDIPIVEITNQYMEYIAEMRRQDLNVMSEFLVMAATLLDIKSKMLLPAKESEDDEEEDPRAELVQQLLEYKMYKCMAYELRDRQIDAEKVWFKAPTIPPEVLAYEEPVDVNELMSGVTLARLNDIFQSIIQGAPLNSELLAPLKNRFQTDSTFQVFCIRIRFGVEDTTAFRQAILHLENHLTLWQKAKRLQSPYLLFEMDDCYTLVINHLPLAYTQEIADQILDQFSYFTRRNMISLGIGSQVNGIASVKSAFSSARMAAQMAYQTDKKIINFQQMGFFKILFAADDTTILKSYEQQLLGPLEEHDRHHHSQYMETLRSYIENDRSLMGVAESTFTHRNTVNYRIQNIKKILNNPLKTAQDLFPYQVAFYIRDMKL